MESVLVTGASGFIGSHLVRSLLADGLRVVGLATGYHGFNRLRGLPSSFALEIGDLRNADSMDALFSRHCIETVYHLASAGVRQGQTHPDDLACINTTGTFRLGRLAAAHGVKSFIHCGSALEYEWSDQPIDETVPLGAACAYGATKAAGWMLLDHLRRAESLPLVTVRPFAVFGPGESPDKLIPYVIRKALARETISLSSGSQVRDYLYVTDLVSALRRAAHQAPAGAVFNIGVGAPASCTVRSIVETILRLTGAPGALCQFGAHRRLCAEPPCLVADAGRARSLLGWSPSVTREDGIRHTISAMSVSTTAVSSKVFSQVA